jgi:transcriptional regulator with XRE-family HTH domain
MWKSQDSNLERFGENPFHGGMKFHEKLTQLLGNRRGEPAEVARKIEVDASQFAKLKQGKLNPTAEQIFRIARHYGVPMEYLYDDEMKEIPPKETEGIDPYVIETIRTLGNAVAKMRLLKPSPYEQDLLSHELIQEEIHRLEPPTGDKRPGEGSNSA